MNLINQRQNERSSIELIAAQRHIYSSAKWLLGIYAFLAIPFLILANTVGKHYAITLFNIDLTNWIAILALVLTLFDVLWLKTKVIQLQEKAATIQEQFDRYVYNLHWNPISLGNKVSIHEISKHAVTYSNKHNLTELNNWYSEEVSNHNERKGILLCQSESLGWDIELRTSYIFYVSVFIVLYLLAIFSTALYEKVSLTDFILSYIIPSLPLLTYFRGVYVEQRRAIDSKKALSVSLDEALSKPIVSLKTIESLQFQIYTNRKSNPLIFDWFNRIKSKNLQELVTTVTKTR
ncbi:S-4TM family putative pore-forming effector [Vibrio sp. ZSDE26]|uniref:S-4TM family putative pore-forming effector n=1 Tax=Vibrio amylolyticus TaxID=2847292 RepID=A0A9X2BJV8_9VIBR|nr:S-4TM family putative pore-forming effector [Vibrio amylolyticus]